MADGWIVSDGDLSEVLWGRNPPSTSQAQIYTYASRLRGHLGTEATIVRRGHGYQMERGAARYDLAEFDASASAGRAFRRDGRVREAAAEFRRALGLWTGPTLTAVTDCLADREGPRIELVRAEVLEERIDAELHLGHHQRLIGELSQLVGAHPLRESLRAKLMIALYRSDRQAEALAAFHEGSSLLRDQLGVDPGPALRGALQEILTGRPAPVRSPAGGAVAARVS